MNFIWIESVALRPPWVFISVKTTRPVAYHTCWVLQEKNNKDNSTLSPLSLMTMSNTTKLTMCLTTRKIDILLNALKKFMWKQNCALTTICRGCEGLRVQGIRWAKARFLSEGCRAQPAMLVGGGQETSSLSSADVLACPSSASIHSSPPPTLNVPRNTHCSDFHKVVLLPSLPSVWYRDMCKINDVYSCRGKPSSPRTTLASREHWTLDPRLVNK